MLLVKPIEVDIEKSFYPPMELAYLAAALEDAKENVEVIDCRVMENYLDKICLLLKKHSLVGITTTIGNISSAIEIAKAIREHSKDVKIIMGGPHASVIYNNLIPQYADIAVIGEGERTIVELVKNADLSAIKGIVYWDNGIRLTPHREPVKNLDEIKFPTYRSFDFSTYRNYRWGFFKHRPMYVVTSRGCPFTCLNCTKFVHGFEVRLRSIDNVMEELNFLIKVIGAKEIHFWDDVFTFFPERVKELCQRIIDAGYPRDVFFALPGGVRADIDDMDMFKMLKKANFYYLTIAIESGVQDIINKLGKKLDLEQAKKSIKAISKVGFERVQAFFIIGLPFDTVETIKQSIDFAARLPIDSALFFICLPLPGTGLYNIVKEKGRFLQDITVTGSYFTGKATFEMGHLSAKDIERMFKLAYRKFYLNPKRIWRILLKNIISGEIFTINRILHYYDAFRLGLVAGDMTRGR